MTLITYPTRVHFAEGILQEALHSELDRVNSKSVLLVCDAVVAEGELMDRVQSGMPARVSAQLVTIQNSADLRKVASEFSSETFGTKAEIDTIVAFGSSKATELGRKVRFAIGQARGNRPLLFAIPSLDGLPDPCTRSLESRQAGLPSVVICDPMLINGSGAADSLRAVVMSLVRCIEAYLSNGYNPPADGMALEGVSRCVDSFNRIGSDSERHVYRDVMAAALNAFLSQEKGMGPAQTMTARLLSDAPDANRAAVARLVLPGVMRARKMDGTKAEVLRKVLSDADEPLVEATDRILSSVKMPRTLADIGIPHDALDPAAHSVAGSAGLTFQNARTVLERAYEGA